jgi:hypothetical protein
VLVQVSGGPSRARFPARREAWSASPIVPVHDIRQIERVAIRIHGTVGGQLDFAVGQGRVRGVRCARETGWELRMIFVGKPLDLDSRRV